VRKKKEASVSLKNKDNIIGKYCEEEKTRSQQMVFKSVFGKTASYLLYSLIGLSVILLCTYLLIKICRRHPGNRCRLCCQTPTSKFHHLQSHQRMMPSSPQGGGTVDGDINENYDLNNMTPSSMDILEAMDVQNVSLPGALASNTDGLKPTGMLRSKTTCKVKRKSSNRFSSIRLFLPQKRNSYSFMMMGGGSLVSDKPGAVEKRRASSTPSMDSINNHSNANHHSDDQDERDLASPHHSMSLVDKFSGILNIDPFAAEADVV